MNAIDDCARQVGRQVDQPSILEVNRAFVAAYARLNLSSMTATGRERRVNQLKWTTEVKNLRKVRRSA